MSLPNATIWEETGQVNLLFKYLECQKINEHYLPLPPIALGIILRVCLPLPPLALGIILLVCLPLPPLALGIILHVCLPLPPLAPCIIIRVCLPLPPLAPGRVVNMASGLARMAMPMRSAYVTSKYAVAGLTECLRMEMKSWGVHVSIIEPGNYISGEKKYAMNAVSLNSI